MYRLPESLRIALESPASETAGGVSKPNEYAGVKREPFLRSSATCGTCSDSLILPAPFPAGGLFPPLFAHLRLIRRVSARRCMPRERIGGRSRAPAALLSCLPAAPEQRRQR